MSKISNRLGDILKNWRAETSIELDGVEGDYNIICHRLVPSQLFEEVFDLDCGLESVNVWKFHTPIFYWAIENRRWVMTIQPHTGYNMCTEESVESSALPVRK